MKNIILFATSNNIGCAQSKDKKVVPKVVKRLLKEYPNTKVDIEKTVLKQNLK
jgi:hypothetical protein